MRHPSAILNRHPAMKVTLVLIGAVLLLVNGGGWVLYHYLAASVDAALGDHLISIGEMIALETETMGLAGLIEGMGEDWANVIPALLDGEEVRSATMDEFIDVMAEMDLWAGRVVRVAGLSRLLLLDREGRALLDTSGVTEIGESEVFIHVDRPEFLIALGGKPASTVAYPLGDVFFKRAYVPIPGPGGEGASMIVSLEAGSERLAGLKQLRRYLVAAGLFSLALAVFLILLVYRIIWKNLLLERAAERAGRALEMGQMTATVAHEIRNPLGILRTNAEYLKETQNLEEAREIAEEIIGEADRISATVHRFSLLSGANEAPPRFGAIESCEFFQAAEAFLARYPETRKDAEGPGLKIDLALEHPFPVPFSKDDLAIVLRNLLDNAMESGTREPVTVFARIEGNILRVEIRDRGRGMNRGEVENALRPFYTTREKGSGIGLSLALRLMERAGGSLRIESRKGKGTRVVLVFPRALDTERTQT